MTSFEILLSVFPGNLLCVRPPPEKKNTVGGLTQTSDRTFCPYLCETTLALCFKKLISLQKRQPLSSVLPALVVVVVVSYVVVIVLCRFITNVGPFPQQQLNLYDCSI